MLKKLSGPRAIALIVIVAVVAIAAFVAVSRAQAPQPPPQRIQVTFTQIKPDMILTFEDLVRNEQIPAQKKVGIAWRRTYATLTGEQNVRVTAVPLPSYAELDKAPPIQRAASAEAYANYQAKVRATIQSQRIEIQTLQPNESIIGNETTPSPLLQVQTVKLLPGKAADFAASLREDYLPAYKKAGVTAYALYAINQGNTGGVLVRPIPNWAELDKPPLLQRAGLTQDQQDKIAARRAATLASGIETIVLRLVPDMSYGTLAPPSQRSTN